MRVTSGTFPSLISSQLTRLSTRQARLQTQAGTGQRFQVASEDPRAMRQVLDLQGEMKTHGQYGKNIARLRETLDASYAVSGALKKITDRAGEIATLVTDTRTADELTAYSAEVNQLLEQALQLSNTRHNGVYLFSGTKSTEPAFTFTKGADGKVSSVTYQGSSTVPEAEISEGISLSVHVPGVNTTGVGQEGLFGDARTGGNLFAHLISLRDNLANGNVREVTNTDLHNIIKDEETVVNHFGFVGAAQTRLDTALAMAERRSASLEALISKEADADLAATLVSLNEIQNAYMAALKTGGTILSQSLLDYIR